MSKYWEKMFILHDEDSQNNSLFITDKKPDFFAPKGAFTIKEISRYDPKDQKILEKLSAFYCKENILANGNMTKVSVSDLEKYLRVGQSVMVYVESKITKEIAGSILNVLLPIRLNMDIDTKTPLERTEHYRSVSNSQHPQDVVFAATTFLNNHRKYRGKGLGMVLIQHSLQKAYQLGIPCAYFLNSVPRCSNSVEIKCWSYPLNVDKLRRYRLVYNRRYTDYYQNLNDEIVRVEKSKPQDYQAYIELVENKKFALHPDENYWKRWTDNFLTYTVFKGGQVIGVFSYFKYVIYVPACGRELNYSNRLICVAKPDEKLLVCRAMLAQAQRDDIDMMLLQEIGDLDKDLLMQIHASWSKVSDYLNFYNAKLKITAADIYAPMI